MARKKKTETEEQAFFEEVINSVDAGKKTEVESELDSNRALRLGIIEQLEKINNRYYLLIIKKYLDNLK